MWQCFIICEDMNPRITPPTHRRLSILWRLSHECYFIVFILYSLNK